MIINNCSKKTHNWKEKIAKYKGKTKFHIKNTRKIEKNLLTEIYILNK